MEEFLNSLTIICDMTEIGITGDTFWCIVAMFLCCSLCTILTITITIKSRSRASSFTVFNVMLISLSAALLGCFIAILINLFTSPQASISFIISTDTTDAAELYRYFNVVDKVTLPNTVMIEPREEFREAITNWYINKQGI